MLLLSKKSNISSVFISTELIEGLCKKPHIRNLFIMLDDEILKINEDIYHKYAKTAVTYYCPEKTFVYLKFRKTSMLLHIYVNQKKLDGVKNISIRILNYTL